MAVLTCLALALLPATQARAAPGWLAPTDLSATGQYADFPDVALDAHGDATAVWVRSDGTKDRVQVAERPAGGSWQPAVVRFAVARATAGRSVRQAVQGAIAGARHARATSR